MLLSDLRKIARACCFNPKAPNKAQKVTLDVGSPPYWTIKSMELIRKAQDLNIGSPAYNQCIEEATTLLILTRGYVDDTAKANGGKKTRNSAAGKDRKVAKSP